MNSKTKTSLYCSSLCLTTYHLACHLFSLFILFIVYLPTPISSRFLIFLILFTLSKRYQILSHKENRGANGWHVSLLVLPHHKNVLALCSPFSFSPMKMQEVALFLFKVTFPLPPKWLFFMLFPPNYPIFFTPFIKFVHFSPRGLKISTFIIY